MFRTLVACAALVSPAVHAQSGLLTLLKHRPVHEFIQAAESAHFTCKLLGMGYWDAMQARGDASAEYRQIQSCISDQKDAPREKLVLALKYLSDKPSSAKALKDFYLKWTAKLESLRPDYRETYKSYAERTRKADDALKESQRALELELELGT